MCHIVEFDDGAKAYLSHPRPAFPHLLVLKDERKFRFQEIYPPAVMVDRNRYLSEQNKNWAGSGTFNYEEPCPWGDLIRDYDYSCVRWMNKKDKLEWATNHGGI